MHARTCATFVLAAGLAAGCVKTDPLFCESTADCTDPSRPYCDLTGEHDPGGHPKSCVPDPFDASVPDTADAAPGEPDAGPDHIVEVSAGANHTCARTAYGRVRCWGRADLLGYPSEEDIGDDEYPSEGEDVPLPEPALQISAGENVTCAVTSSRRVICWGLDASGALGIPAGDTNTPPDTFVELGAEVQQVAVGRSNACALLVNGIVRCWGSNNSGRLGIGSSEPAIGDDEAVLDAPPVALPAVPVALSGGAYQYCALLEGGRVSCWGTGENGALGYGNADDIGDDESPADAGFVDTGFALEQVATHSLSTCGRSSSGRIRCWGKNGSGALGAELPPGEIIGDEPGEMPPASVELGGEAAQVEVNTPISCALLTDGSVKCWGMASFLGAGAANDIGDDEPVAAGPSAAIGAPARSLDLGSSHACVVTAEHQVRCWGQNQYVWLGYATDEPIIGDDELPSEFGDVPVFPDL